MSEESKRKAPAFQFYADDFLAGTSDMSAEEVGGYIRLLCHQWTKGGIPNDPDRAARMAGLMGSPSVGYVLAKFSLCEDGMLRNARMERVRQEQAEFKARQSTSGKSGAQKRWSKCQNDGDANGDPNGVAIATPMATPMAKRCPEDSSPSPTPNNLNTDTKVLKAIPPELEAFRIRMGTIVRRRPDTKWSPKEIKALKEVFELKTPEEDIRLVEARYKTSDPYLRRDVMALLNNWNGEVDKVRSGITSIQVEERTNLSLNLKDYL